MAETETDLPKALVKRIVKLKLNQVTAAADEARRDVQLNRDALLAFAESAKVFINYITATANDICKERNRSTISADDVFQALEELDFGEFVEPLKQALEVFKHDTKEKNARRAENRKRKAEERPDDAAGPMQDDTDEVAAATRTKFSSGDALDEDEPFADAD